VTPAETSQERRDAAIKRSRRIDALNGWQDKGALHRIAAFDPGCVDRALREIEANTRPLHPVRIYAADPVTGELTGRGLVAHCDLESDWHVHIEDGHLITELQRLAAEHSGIEQP
jgi:hypothetical protein